MAITFGGLANMQTQSALAIGQSQASSMGLGKDEGNALAISNMMGGDDEKPGEGLVNKLMSGGGMKNRMKGSAFKQDLQDIAGAALAIGPGRGSGMSASSSMMGKGSIVSKVI
ncbi:hypothetical protein KJ781_04650 [Patescibacteria group bacterium]|nr:hypothetical protein [Patescibacteria group bacterium]MBU1449026.1 hypothetical protein [Patescibacteria group bacterium]